MNVAELLTIPAGMYPEQEALRFDGQAFTYEALQRAAGGAQALLAGRGIASGDRVAALDTNSPLLAAYLFASAAQGAAFTPLNYRARAGELRSMLSIVRPRVLVAGERYLELAREVAECDVLPLNGVEAPEEPGERAADTPSPTSEREGWGEGPRAIGEGSSPLVPAEVDDGHPAVLMFTSGTSADAKAVVLPHGSLVNFVFATTDGADGIGGEAVLLCAPLYHIAGLSALLSATFGGRRIVLMRQFEAGEWLRLVAAERVTHAFLVPTMLKQVLDHPMFDGTDLSSLAVLSYGAAPMPLGLIRRAIERLPESVQLVNAFGQTETTSTVTMLGPEDHRLQGPPEEVERKLRRLRSIGRPLPGVDIRIVDGAGQLLPPGAVGEIAVRSDRLMAGYLGRAEDVRDGEGFLRTRDLGWMDEDGYVYLAGRSTDLIIRGGENIAPAEIEAVLELHPHVAEAAVIGLPDEEWGERVAAVVVPRGQERDAGDIIEFCRARLASYKKPDTVIFVDELPRNALGKVLRKELRARYAEVALLEVR